jgi:hypothetical protein
MPQTPVETEVLGRIRMYKDQELQLRSRQLPGVPPMVEISQYNPHVGNLLACYWPDDPALHRKLASLLLHRAEQIENA